MDLAGPINPKVIDISHYDKIVGGGFQAVRAAGIVGVVQKSSEGAHLPDDRYLERISDIVAAGLCPAAYHFIRPGDMKSQADFFLRCARPDPKTFMVSLDHEVKAVSADAAREFIEEVERLWGRKVVLYSGNVIKEQLDTRIDPWWGARRLWMAQYAAKARWTWNRSWKEPWLLQYTGDGLGPTPHMIPGISITGGLDISHYEYSDDQLRREWVTDMEFPAVPEAHTDPMVPIIPVTSTYIEQGMASWYGDPQPVADPHYPGGHLDVTAMTAAHKTLPFGTRVEVTSLRTNAKVVVTINDRGPYVHGRIIDLTPAAFKKIDRIELGVIPVGLRRVADVSA